MPSAPGTGERTGTSSDKSPRAVPAETKPKPTVKKSADVLLHMMGHFKKVLTADEKRELLEVIDRYREKLIPLIVPVTLIGHYVRKYRVSYLDRQVFLNPHPVELMLRNHV